MNKKHEIAAFTIIASKVPEVRLQKTAKYQTDKQKTRISPNFNIHTLHPLSVSNCVPLSMTDWKL
jgi:hypothetical protein